MKEAKKQQQKNTNVPFTLAGRNKQCGGGTKNWNGFFF